MKVKLIKDKICCMYRVYLYEYDSEGNMWALSREYNTGNFVEDDDRVKVKRIIVAPNGAPPVYISYPFKWDTEEENAKVISEKLKQYCMKEILKGTNVVEFRPLLKALEEGEC